MTFTVSALGSILFLGGVLYLVYPSGISTVNEWMRENIFSDRHLLLNRKKIGLFLVFTGAIMIFFGFLS